MTQRALAHDGWGRYTVGVVHAMQARGVKPVLITAAAEVDPALKGIEPHAVLPPLFQRRLEMPRSLMHANALKPLLADCDVVHCLLELYLPLVSRSMPAGVPLVMTAHGSWAVRPLRSPLRRWFYRLVLSRVDRIVFQSEETRKRMARWTKLPGHVVMPGGVDPSAFAGRASAGLPNWAQRGPVVLSVGALKRRKGHEIALQAAASAAARFPQMQFVIIGEGASSHAGRSLQAQAAALGLSGRFHLLEAVSQDELAAWYRRAAVYILLPVDHRGGFEGFGLTYLEAAAAGVPCIATDGCGAAEAVLDGETGLLVPQHDPEAAASALTRLLTDDRLRADMGRAGHRHAARHRWARLAEGLHSQYLMMVKARRAARDA